LTVPLLHPDKCGQSCRSKKIVCPHEFPLKPTNPLTVAEPSPEQNPFDNVIVKSGKMTAAA
jgi:hypothetical protein